MNVKYLIVTVVETIVKVVIIAAVIVFVMRGAAKAYDFGYRVFADTPVSVSGGRTITVGVAEDASIKDIAEMLVEKGLIEDANLFVVQELLSAHHGDILPGIYDLSTDMTAQQMLEIMSTPTEKETGSNADSSKEQESGIEENTGEDSTDEGAENPDGEAAE
ncbi:MAG: aminodeoxychorismate lyase [Lachnospiraceae bacterium]|jgi:UPF0755 protein|nr:aminodeoxychorismate lyase [Lachnospiraceae bacterium]